MDRHHLFVGISLLGLLTGAGGCSSTTGGFRLFSAGAAKRDDEEARKPGTYVAFGDFRLASATANETPQELRQQYFEDARRSYLKALEVDPKYVPAYEAMVRLMFVHKDEAAAIGY